MIISLMRFVVRTKQVTAEVALQVAPDTVDMIGVVQLVEARALNALELLSCSTLRHPRQ